MKFKVFNNLLLRETVYIIFLSLVFGLAYNFIVYGNINFLERKKDVSGKLNKEYPQSKIKEISIDEAIKLVNEGALLIDARAESDFTNGHIEGAINIPTKNFDNYIEKVFQISTDTSIVIYCEGIHCNLSHSLAEKLLNFGFTKINVMVEGIEGWKKRNLEIVK